MPGAALDDYYWYLDELVAFCRAVGLPASGQKHEVLARVRLHLDGGSPVDMSAVPTRRRAAPPGARRFAADTPVDDSFRCDEQTRAFFKQLIGPHFHFTAHLQRFRCEHRGAPLTYGDLAREWIAEYERRKDKDYRPPIMPAWEYNKFVRDFLADQSRNAGKGIREAAAAWNAMRLSSGPRDYASSVAGLPPAEP